MLVLKRVQSFLPTFRGSKFGATSTAQHRAALLDYAPNIPPTKRYKIPFDEPAKTMFCAQYFPAFIQTSPHYCPNSGIHARRIATASQHRNLVHNCFIPFKIFLIW
jgi:hypothetical protein